MIDLKRIEAAALRFFANARGSHDWDHTRRVVALCERIGPAENAEMTVLRIAALLHDIGRADQDGTGGKLCHATRGAEMAKPVVDQLPLTASQKANVLHCIRTHRFRGDAVPETVEAKVLFDADKLDGIGAVGIARAYLFAGEIGARLHNPDTPAEKTTAYSEDDTGYREYVVKLRHVRERMQTRTGRALAEERHAFMETFFERFLAEYEGLA